MYNYRSRSIVYIRCILHSHGVSMSHDADMQISTLRCDEHMLPVKMAELPEVTDGASCGRPKVDVNLL